MSFLGIDIGATFLKGAVLDAEDLKLDAVVRKPFPPFLEGLPHGLREVAPEAILSTVRVLLEELITQCDTCEGIFFCSQMHGLVLMDSHGKPRSNFVSWQDQRALSKPADSGETFFERLSGQFGPDMRRRTGNEFRPGLPVVFMHHMAETGDPLAGMIPMDLGGFVLSALAEMPVAMDRTMAHAHGAWNVETESWDHDTIDLLGLGRLTWPEIVAPATVAGHLKRREGLIPCYAAMGDQQCSLLGAGLRTDELSINIATGSQVSARAATVTYGDCQVRPYFGGYIHTVTHIPAGRSLNLLVKLLTECRPDTECNTDVWSFIEKRVKEVRETDLVVDVSFFPGAFRDRGRIENIHERNLSVGHIFRAAFESMADDYQRAALRLPGSGNWKGLVFSGGLARASVALRDAVEERFTLPVHITPSDDDSLLGLLAMARATKTSVSPEEAAEQIRQQRERTMA